MIALPDRWAPALVSQPETGMGYQIASIVLKDGRRFDRVVIVEGIIAQIRGFTEIPFRGDDIAEVIVTHDKWDFNAKQ